MPGRPFSATKACSTRRSWQRASSTTPISALLYSPGAVVVTLLHFALPFAVLPIYAAMRGIKDIEIEVARDLGASPLETFSTIIVPRCRAGIVTAFSFSFLITAGDYVTPMLVGGKQTMIGNLIAPQFGSMFNWPLGAGHVVRHAGRLGRW